MKLLSVILAGSMFMFSKDPLAKNTTIIKTVIAVSPSSKNKEMQ